MNPGVPDDALEAAFLALTRPEAATLVRQNRELHTLLRDGFDAETVDEEGEVRGVKVWASDRDDPAADDWLVVRQLTLPGTGRDRRPDLVLYGNGLPLAVIEMKSALAEDADVWAAYHQLQTYRAELPGLFRHNAVLVASDLKSAVAGSLTAGSEWFKAWRAVDAEKGDGADDSTGWELETMVRGLLAPDRLLATIRHYTLFEEGDDGEVRKVLAGYHQVHAVEAALEAAVKAAAEDGDRRAGVVWHTQGSGKSLTMLFFAGGAVERPALANPTLVLLTDRNDLDDQLFAQFRRGADLIRQRPAQADGVGDLRAKLSVASGGVVFTTLQKFLPDADAERVPELTARRNVLVVADEAHRSQYGFASAVDRKTGRVRTGLASNLRDALPNASFVGFTGTPVESADADTRAVFGDYVSVYDVRRAVEDRATVPIFYESRVAKLRLAENLLDGLDAEVDRLTENREAAAAEAEKAKWATLEAVVGDPDRLAVVAKDLVAHFMARREANAALPEMGGVPGEGMVVCMSRRICVALHDEIVKLQPDWDGDAVHVVMTGSAGDPPGWQRHVRSKGGRKELARRFKDPTDPFALVLVRDMWLTGFDAPSLHTMYVDKPMGGHNLMQAIARVNRVFRDKPGGLVVDYLGLADQLRAALVTYTDGGGTGEPTVELAEAVAVMREKHEVCVAMLSGVDWSVWKAGDRAAFVRLLPAAQEAVLRQEDGKARWKRAVADLAAAFALCATTPEAAVVRDDLAFFAAVKAVLLKPAAGTRSPREVEAAVRQLVSGAVVPDGEVIDVFEAAGTDRPDVGVLSEEFLADVAHLKHPNVAAELLRKLLTREIASKASASVVAHRKFSDLLRATLNRYHNRAISAQEVIGELTELARLMKAHADRGEATGLGRDELAFYEALAANDSAVEVFGDAKLAAIAAELVTLVRENASIDWHRREQVRANLRRLVKRVLRKFGYPPDLQDEAVKTVLKQAEALRMEMG